MSSILNVGCCWMLAVSLKWRKTNVNEIIYWFLCKRQFISSEVGCWGSRFILRQATTRPRWWWSAQKLRLASAAVHYRWRRLLYNVMSSGPNRLAVSFLWLQQQECKGRWMLDAECWLLDARCWKLDPYLWCCNCTDKLFRQPRKLSAIVINC